LLVLSKIETVDLQQLSIFSDMTAIQRSEQKNPTVNNTVVTADTSSSVNPSTSAATASQPTDDHICSTPSCSGATT